LVVPEEKKTLHGKGSGGMLASEGVEMWQAIHERHGGGFIGS
jgi:hypothetical protein